MVKHRKSWWEIKTRSNLSESGQDYEWQTIGSKGFPMIEKDFSSAGTLLWIYRRLIGRSYITLARQDQYIGSTRETHILIIWVFVCNIAIVFVNIHSAIAKK